ncbi:MAG: RNA-directed DNA polymerase, partial [Anaerolineae bacterium]
LVRAIVKDEGYEIQRRKRMRVLRQHQQQKVTGLVVNERLNVPRKVRRRLRAMQHQIETGRQTDPAVIASFEGWQSYLAMVEQQREA